MDNNYMKTILSGIKEWTRSLIQKTANNVQRTAETAQAAADTAQRTADNAQRTADDAQRTADDALHLQISYDDQILIWDGTTTTTESTVQVEYFTQVAKSGSTKKTRYYRISNIPDNIVKYAFAHYKDIKCAIKVQNGTENELELTNDWYVDYSGLCVSSSNYYILIARESGSHAVRIPGALQPTWLDFPQAGIYIGYCTDSSVEGDAGKSFTYKIALPTYGLPLDSVILTTDSDKNIQVVDTETGTKKTLKSAYAYAQDGGYTGTEAEFAAKLAAEKLPNPYPLTFTGAVSETYDGSSAKTIEIPSGGGGSAWHTIGTQKMDGVETAVSFDLDGETIIQIIVTANWNEALTATKATVSLTLANGETVQFTPQTMNASSYSPKNIFTIFGNSKQCRQMIFSKAEGALYSSVQGSFGVAYGYDYYSEHMVEDKIATGITITFDKAPSNAAVVKVEGM